MYRASVFLQLSGYLSVGLPLHLICYARVPEACFATINIAEKVLLNTQATYNTGTSYTEFLWLIRARNIAMKIIFHASNLHNLPTYTQINEEKEYFINILKEYSIIIFKFRIF